MVSKLYNNGLKCLEKISPSWSMSEDYGAVTAANSTVFPGLLALFFSLKNKINFVCYDLGLSDNERDICKQIGLNIATLSLPTIIQTLPNWYWYVKPWAIEQSSKEYTLWFDTDCIVSGNLSTARHIQNKQTFFVKTFVRPEYLKNNTACIYEKFPVKNPNLPMVNSGIFGVHKKDVKPFVVDEWMSLIIQSFECDFHDKLVYQDEGALFWALQKQNRDDLIIQDYSYNKPCIYNYNPFAIDMIYDPLCISPVLTSSMFFKKSLNFAEQKKIFGMHFVTGCKNMKKKYWLQWTSEQEFIKGYQYYKNSTNSSW